MQTMCLLDIFFISIKQLEAIKEKKKLLKILRLAIVSQKLRATYIIFILNSFLNYETIF